MPNLINCKQQGSSSYSILEATREFSILTLLTNLLLGEAINPKTEELAQNSRNFASAQQYYTSSHVGKPDGLIYSQSL